MPKTKIDIVLPTDGLGTINTQQIPEGTTFTGQVRNTLKTWPDRLFLRTRSRIVSLDKCQGTMDDALADNSNDFDVDHYQPVNLHITVTNCVDKGAAKDV